MKNSLSFFKAIITISVLFYGCNNTNSNNTAESDSLTTDTIFKEVILEDTVANETAEYAVFKKQNGEKLSTKDFKGKVQFINFWATWCPPCRKEMPSIEVLYNKFKDNNNIVFHIVEIENDTQGTKSFLKENNISLPIVYADSDIPETWLGNAIPTTIILDKQGNVVEKVEGMLDYSQESVFSVIEKLINQ